MEKTIDNIKYFGHPIRHRTKARQKLAVYGIDTEAYKSGTCFMVATSEGDVFKRSEFPRCFFTRKYIGKVFVAYNLSYDAGALLQHIPVRKLDYLRQGDRIEHEGFKYYSIPKKLLRISRRKHAITIYDMYNFYMGSLDYNAALYLGKEKIKEDVTKYTRYIVKKYWSKIAKYCVNDAVLVKELAEHIINKFASFGVFPSALYSTAYVSYQYFREHTNYVTVARWWKEDKKLLDYAMRSYNGGKFEVIEKGTGYFYEYDIVSAYPYEISKLIDIQYARCIWSNKYRKFAPYAFIKARIKIPTNMFSPVAVKYGCVNTYPTGEITKVITKSEYDYLIEAGADVSILKACWLHVDKKTFPYRKEIQRLVKLKSIAKVEGNALDYHTIKIFLNALYGKFVQLVFTGKSYKASTCWNPVYGSIITANTRVRITDIQNLQPSVIAVHTDSIISRRPITFNNNGQLGDMVFEKEGQGVIIGSGIYQVGNKSKFRGFTLKNPLLELVDTKKKYIEIDQIHASTWRECAFHGWSNERINRFENAKKRLRVNFDTKRLWIKDYTSFQEVLKRNVESVAWTAGLLSTLS